jgi:hypothetical protein
MLTRSQQRPLKTSRDMPAILDRPHPLTIKRGGEPQPVQRAGITSRDLKLPSQHPGLPIERDQRVVALVGICPDHDHVLCPLR